MTLDRKDYKSAIPQLDSRLKELEETGKKGLANFDILQDLIEKEILERERLYLKQDTSINTITVKMYYLLCDVNVTPTPDTAGWSETMPKIDYSNDEKVLWYMSKTFRNGAVIETSTPQQVQLMDGVFAFINSVSGDEGWTTIDGGTIATGRIQDNQTGDNYFNLDTGEFNFQDSSTPPNYIRNDHGNGLEIQGTLSLSSAVGSGTLNDIVEDMADFAQDVIDINGDIQSLQSQIDGNITTWFYAYVPTNSNAPASDWISAGTESVHLGDLFYDTTTGYAYRWQSDGATPPNYSWLRITDSDVTKALADAAKAQDTADHKRRVFVTTPTPPYDVGDLWAEGSSGDLKKCKIAKADGQSYLASDWELASKYTDDSAFTAFRDGTYASFVTNTGNALNTKITTYYQTSAPTTTITGDLWIDTDDGNKLYRWNGSSWVSVQDGAIQTALTNASNAQTTADSKIVTFAQASQPTATDVGDLWIDTDDDNKLYRWSGTAWVSVQDGKIQTALTTANGADFRTQYIYKSQPSGTNSLPKYETWVTDVSGDQNTWTATRPKYNTSYPVLFIARQSQTMQQSSGNSCSCTDPVKDDTTTVIDGGHITTGTIDANRITATVVNAINATADKIDAKNINVDGTLIVGASDVATTINDIDVGSRNLLIGSDYLYNKINAYSSATLTKTSGVTVAEWSATDATTISGTGGTNAIVATAYGLASYIAQTPMTVTIGETYSFSIYVKNNHATKSIDIRPNGSSSSGSAAYKTVSAGEAKKLTWTWTAATASNIQFNIATPSAGDAFNVTFWHPMYVVGNKATSWTPAPEDINVGGTNLIPHSKNLKDFTKEADTYVTRVISDNYVDLTRMVVSGKENTNYGVYYRVDTTTNTDYTVSFNISGVTADTVNIGIGQYSPSPSSWSDLTGGYKQITSNGRFAYTFNTKTATKITVYIALKCLNSVQYTVRVSDIKLEKGNQATDWSPAPSDPAETATSYITQIDDGGINVHDVNSGYYTHIDGNSISLNDANGNSGFSVASSGNTDSRTINRNYILTSTNTVANCTAPISTTTVTFTVTPSGGSTTTATKTNSTLAVGSSFTLGGGTVTFKRVGTNDIKATLSGSTRTQICVSYTNSDDYAKVNFTGDNNILLNIAGSFMIDTQTYNLSESVSEQLNGIVLCWSAYVDGSAQDYDWNYTFVPKDHVLRGSPGVGTGLLTSAYYPSSNSAYWGFKYVYVYDTTITGHEGNNKDSTFNGIPITNRHWVLRYVLGV